MMGNNARERGRVGRFWKERRKGRKKKGKGKGKKKREKEEKSNGGKKKEAEKDYKNEGREKAFLFLKFSKLQIEKKNVSPIQIPFEGNNGSICFRYLKPRFIVTFHLALVKIVCRKILVNKSCCPEESHNQ